MSGMFAVYGNCQSAAISTVLCSSTRFSEMYRRSWLRYCFEISEEEVLNWCETDAPDVSVLIIQRLKAGWRGKYCFDTKFLREHVKSDAVVLSYSDIYYRGYTPEWVGPLLYPRPEFCGYMNLIAQYCFVNNQGLEAVRDFYTNPRALSIQVCETIHSVALSDLFVRERNCDVKTSKILAEKWRAKRLFIAYNHPSRELFSDVCDQIYEMSGFQGETADRSGAELLNDVRLFSPRSFDLLLEQLDELDKKFSINITDKCNGGIDGFLSATFDYYSKIDRSVLAEDLRLQAEKSNISWLLLDAVDSAFSSKSKIGWRFS